MSDNKCPTCKGPVIEIRKPMFPPGSTTPTKAERSTMLMGYRSTAAEQLKDKLALLKQDLDTAGDEVTRLMNVNQELRAALVGKERELVKLTDTLKQLSADIGVLSYMWVPEVIGKIDDVLYKNGQPRFSEQLTAANAVVEAVGVWKTQHYPSNIVGYTMTKADRNLLERFAEYKLQGGDGDGPEARDMR